MNTTTTRPTFAEFLATVGFMEPVLPPGYIICDACDSTGTETHGYRDGQPIEERCNACHGFGRVVPRCPHCLDRGEYAVADADGHHDGVEFCSCHAGRVAMEADSIDSLKAGWETTRPDYVQHSHARIDAGDPPF